MKPIKLYFAGTWTFNDLEDEMNLITQNRLVSYAYASQFGQWNKLNQAPESNIIIDSGAFSAWNNDTVIDIDDYIAYCHKCMEEAGDNKNIYVVNLDVIPGKVGQTAQLNNPYGAPKEVAKRRKIIDKAAKAGHENMMIMKSNGITPIHVFHQGEDWKWLDSMLEEVDYIGISPANDMSNKDKKNWMESVFNYLAKNGMENVDTHGFAVMSISVLRDFPWTSCDAASWRLTAAYGKVFYPLKGFSSGVPILKRKDYQVIDVSERKNPDGFSPNITKLFEQDGYDYNQLRDDHNERARVNVHFTLQMEKDLNEYKSKKKFKTVKRLL